MKANLSILSCRFHFYKLSGSVCQLNGVLFRLFLSFYFNIRINTHWSYTNTYSADSEQKPRVAASDLDLQCLPNGQTTK